MKKNCFFGIHSNLYGWSRIISCVLIALCISMLSPARICAENAPLKTPLKIVFFNNATPEDYWWHNASLMMQAACDDFLIELDIYYADRNQLLMVRQFEHAIKTTPRIDGVIFANLKQNMVKMLTLAERAKIPAFVFNAGLTEEDEKTYGGPREVFKYWIGQILPGDEQAGYDLAKVLFAQAKKLRLTDKQNKIHVVGLGGTISDIAAIEREKGLINAAAEDPRVVLHQIVPASWSRQRGQSVFTGLKSRYPDTAVVWAANDPMGLGAIDGMKSLNLKPGTDILVGSIDWIPEALTTVRSGELTASIGGHFLESAWSVVLLYDYLSHNDFAEESVTFRSKMGILTQENIESHVSSFNSVSWGGIDFKKFSKTTHPQLEKYNFTFDAILEQVSP